jgi:peptide/nickel transport system permease protein
MVKYAIRRTLLAIPVLIGISLMTFAILQIAPGGPEARFAQNPKITPEQIAAFRHKWGLDDPIPVQYLKWLGVAGDKGVINVLPQALGGGDNGILHGDFGFSITTGRPVTAVIGERILPTVILAGTSYIIWIVIAFLLGVYAAVRRYSTFDTIFTIGTYSAYALPTFLLGFLLIFLFTTGEPFKWFPVGGMGDTRTSPAFGSAQYWIYAGKQPLTALWDLGRHLVLPVITLIAINIAGDSRFIRASMLDALNQDYVKTARAKGVSTRGVVYRHALRNALLPAITNIGLELPFLFSGAIVTETVFSWPGMGRLAIEATNSFDYPVLMGVLMVAAVVVVVANILADVAYAIADPRVRYE